MTDQIQFITDARTLTLKILESMQNNDENNRAWERKCIDQFQDQQYMTNLIASKNQ